MSDFMFRPAESTELHLRLIKMPGRCLKTLLLLMVKLVVYVVSEDIVENSGRNVLLPCIFQPSTLPTSFSLVWKKLPSTNILFYENGKTDVMDEYAGRVHLNENEIPQGNLSLVLSNIQKSDEGEYTCYILESARSLDIKLFVKESTFGSEMKERLKLEPVTEMSTAVTEDNKASGRGSGNTGVNLIPQKFSPLFLVAVLLFLYGH
ncbi:CD276 antigen homolog isoform X1 [Polypterus senegalus]|uniref:CD276 antigen homolog isoform X1 n=1 Tax=Polypterus senegalus TaxID=55291 RepID=UPI001964C2F0|nr:CD276 antigen homolog isoform X1 [Polypterus senegalus]